MNLTRRISTSISRYTTRLIDTSTDESLPRITIPHRMVIKIQEASKIKAISDSRKQMLMKTPIVISCKNRQLNHHRRQAGHSMEPRNLASYGWKGRKSISDHFTIVPHGRNPSIIIDGATFSNLGIHDSITLHLEDTMNIRHPTDIQRQVIPQVLHGSNCLCVAETGCGKTLAYLLPVVELIRRQKNMTQTGENKFNSPRFVIVVPAREIAHQIKSVAHSLSRSVPFYITLCCGNDHKEVTEETLMDVLITTPGSLAALLRRGKLTPTHIQQVILDEVDTLLDDSFNVQLRAILKDLKFHVGTPSDQEKIVSVGTQIIMVGATVPGDMNDTIGDVVPIDCMEIIATDHTHRILPHVRQKFVRTIPSHKPEELLRLLKTRNSSAALLPTIVFCNTHQTVWWVSQFLESNGVPNGMVHGKARDRTRLFESFQSAECDLLVATDICSRGLDTSRAQRIINYDLPSFMSDYIHRAGRVGRVGSLGPGHVVSFVSHKWEVNLVWNIETSARQESRLPNVDANIKRSLTDVIARKFQQHSN